MKKYFTTFVLFLILIGCSSNKYKKFDSYYKKENKLIAYATMYNWPNEKQKLPAEGKIEITETIFKFELIGKFMYNAIESKNPVVYEFLIDSMNDVQLVDENFDNNPVLKIVIDESNLFVFSSDYAKEIIEHINKYKK